MYYPFYEHKMAPSYQAMHKQGTVTVGGWQCRAQSPEMFAIGPVLPIEELDLAQDQADQMQRLFDNCHADQRCVAAQAAMSIGMSKVNHS